MNYRPKISLKGDNFKVLNFHARPKSKADGNCKKSRMSKKTNKRLRERNRWEVPSLNCIIIALVGWRDYGAGRNEGYW